MKSRSGHLLDGAIALALLAFFSAAPPEASAQGAPAKFDVNDVSFLFPLPKTKADIDNLISLDEKLLDARQLWPAEAFASVVSAAKSLTSTTDPGAFDITSKVPAVLEDVRLWKVAGIRVHPAALGTSEAIRKSFGETPTVRLVAQPVTIGTDGNPVLHDFAAHLVFAFVLNSPDKPLPAVPDQASFGSVVEDLKKIKAAVEAKALTTGPLKVHPGFETDVPLASMLRDFVRKHLIAERLAAISFMGVKDPEPWVFFPMRKTATGFAIGDVKGGFTPATQAQAFRKIASPEVVPQSIPNENGRFGPEGASTAPLFEPNLQGVLDQPLFPGSTKPHLVGLKQRDVVDYVANPALAHNFNTDCVSCHTETTRRRELNLKGQSAAVYQRPAGISGVAEEVLPQLERRASWNVRNFGWGVNFFGPPLGQPGAKRRSFIPTVTQRSANEAADSAAFINEHYLKPPQRATGAPAAPVSEIAANPLEPRPTMATTPLTLIMDLKDQENFQTLKSWLEAVDKAPPAENKIRVAMDRLQLVHFARFVFLGDNKLAVITTFDGSFEDYISAFTREIGDIFNKLLSHMKNAPPLPVQQHEQEFLDYVRRHNFASLSFYSSYPSLSVQDILALQPRPPEGVAPK